MTEDADLPQETGALIDHILTRYHDRHRADLARLVPLAAKVERVHEGDPDAPQGLARARATPAQEMEDHMAKEEAILFAAKRAGGRPGMTHPIAVMRADHDHHAQTIALIRDRSGNLTPPDHACRSWRARYSGTAALLDDLAAPIAIENDRLLSRFEVMA